MWAISFIFIMFNFMRKVKKELKVLLVLNLIKLGESGVSLQSILQISWRGRTKTMQSLNPNNETLSGISSYFSSSVNSDFLFWHHRIATRWMKNFRTNKRKWHPVKLHFVLPVELLAEWLFTQAFKTGCSCVKWWAGTHFLKPELKAAVKVGIWTLEWH